MIDYALVGRCGVFCGSCIVYRAFKDSNQLREQIAKKQKCKVEDVRCDGCQTVLESGWEIQRQWGKNCRIIKCLEGKGLKFCFECEIFPNCKNFQMIYKPYLKAHENLIENLERIKTGEVKEWLAEEEKKWVCRECGNPISDYEECHWCGAKLRTK